MPVVDTGGVTPPPKCPKCNSELKVLLFMGVQPDGCTCTECGILYSLEDLQPLAAVIQ